MYARFFAKTAEKAFKTSLGLAAQTAFQWSAEHMEKSDNRAVQQVGQLARQASKSKIRR